MPAYQVVPGRGAYSRRPHLVRDVATGQWLARAISATSDPPEWTADRGLAWRGLPALALRQVDVLLEAHGVEAEME